VPPDAAQVFDVLLAHRSVRRFATRPLPKGTLDWLVAAAQSASTSSNLQTWSVVAVQDQARKQAVSKLCADQAFIREAPLFLVFTADLARLTEVSTAVGSAAAGLDYLEMFLMAAIDAALAAQNVVVAAEALGLGTCYVGAARNQPAELAALLGLPPRVVAVFGLAVGRPAPGQEGAVKPRLPQREVLHREVYDASGRAEAVAEYDRVMREFYTAQRQPVEGSWSQHSAKRVATVESLRGRDRLTEILRRRGFALR
jgi:nitroreductase